MSKSRDIGVIPYSPIRPPFSSEGGKYSGEGEIREEGNNLRELAKVGAELGDGGIAPSGDDPAGLASYLAANPAMTARDYKGKGFTVFSPFDARYVGPDDPSPDRLDATTVRRRATSSPARFLPRAIRIAAARDVGLIWDEVTRRYRLRGDGAGLCPPAESIRGHASRPAATSSVNANMGFQAELPSAVNPAYTASNAHDG